MFKELSIYQSCLCLCMIVTAGFLLSCSGSNNEIIPGKLSNPSFEEEEDGMPAGWKEYVVSGDGKTEYSKDGRTGNKCAAISSDQGAELMWRTSVYVQPYSSYRFKGWIRTENLAPLSGKGAYFNIHSIFNLRRIPGAETQTLTGTNDWTQVEMIFDTEANDAIRINCLLGGWGHSSGKAWFDDLTLELISSRELNPSIIINTEETGAPISKYIYGQFIEHMGRCIYGGIWAEMIEDRKFFYGVAERGSPWKITGNAENVEMNGDDPFVGEHAPEIKVKGDGKAAGIRQEKLGLKKNMVYRGRIVLRGDPEAAPVEVCLSWGPGNLDKETIIFDNIGKEYRTYPLLFTSGRDSDEGVIEIAGLGSGKFSIGAVSLMPEDNIKGFRADVLELIKGLDSPIYRWPGGNFVSGYDWRDGIGDPDLRPPMKNPAWSGIEHNDVGICEYITFCRLIDTEPFITVNSGLGSIELAEQEVEFCNGSVNTPMGKHREDNGFPEPFNVEWWAVGNEMYGDWQLGHMPVKEYIIKHNGMVKAMRDIDPDLKIVAVGNAGSWDKNFLAGASENMNYISEHFYCQELPGLMSHVMQIPNHVKGIADAVREYRKTIPEFGRREIPIAMDEWNYAYGRNEYGELGKRFYLKDALGLAAGLNEYYRNSDIIYMANYAQTVNVIGCIKTTKTDAFYAVTGLVMKLYRQQFGVIPVKIEGAPEPLEVMAAFNEDRSKLTVSVINPTRNNYNVPFELKGAAFSDNGSMWLIAGGELDYNSPQNKSGVNIRELPVDYREKALNIQPVSISLFEIPLRQ
ncbi:alpha-L-arabinofuranosidase C-terminal domain-containing protein [candidate division KSB1 bacterium]